jgi:ubiquitin-protein ligase
MNVNRRFLKEIRQLYVQQSQRELLDNDYLIHYNEADIHRLHAIIRAPSDSVYRHKFVRLDLKIPDNYPHSPPEVTFVNYDGVRIHPNMYENGKCCATILNTWGDSKFEKWTSSMGIETILITFHSFLDNNPYMYEPGGRDDPSYTVYVLYQSWISCLIRYLQNERIELFNNFIHNYMLTNIDGIFSDLTLMEELYPTGYYETRCFEIERYPIDYSRLTTTLQNYYNYIDFFENHTGEDISFDDFVNREYNCCICYDCDETQPHTFSLQNCKHVFHKPCIKQHIETNTNVCPMCRTELSDEDYLSLTFVEQQDQDHQEDNQEDEWMINPLTRRRIKIGGKTWLYLKNSGTI